MTKEKESKEAPDEEEKLTQKEREVIYGADRGEIFEASREIMEIFNKYELHLSDIMMVLGRVLDSVICNRVEEMVKEDSLKDWVKESREEVKENG